MPKKTSSDELLIGAHTSIAGGPYNALIEGKEIGATTIQIFTASQKRWKGKPIDAQAAYLFQETLKETGIQKVTSHAGYLLNLGSPNPQALKQSREAFQEELERCLQLGISYLNFHPGAALDGTREQCLDTIVESLFLMEKYLENTSLRLLLETTAGQGSSVGCFFEEIGYILHRVKKKIPIGVCVDTCHIFASGYDIRDAASWEKTLEEFDRKIGLKELYAFHINDSLCDLGSRKDRHAQLGEGKIGLESFQFLMRHEVTRNIPKYLETPEKTCWVKEIQMLREFAQ